MSNTALDCTTSDTLSIALSHLPRPMYFLLLPLLFSFAHSPCSSGSRFSIPILFVCLVYNYTYSRRLSSLRQYPTNSYTRQASHLPMSVYSPAYPTSSILPRSGLLSGMPAGKHRDRQIVRDKCSLIHAEFNTESQTQKQREHVPISPGNPVVLLLSC